MSYPEIAIVCQPTADQPVALVSGASKDVCARCGSEVWVSPASRAVLARHPQAGIVCLPCFAPIAHKTPRFTTAAHQEERRRVNLARAGLN